jgi:hypothetical protein
MLLIEYARNHDERPSADELLKHPFLQEIPNDEDEEFESVSSSL